MTSMSVQCHYKCNSELRHLRMGEYRKTDDDKQACTIEFVLLSILSTNLYIDLHCSSSNEYYSSRNKILTSTVWFRDREEPT